MILTLPIFIRVIDIKEIIDFTRIAFALFSDGTIDWWESKCYLEDMGLELIDLDSVEMVFCYYENWYPTKITLYSSGDFKVETNIDEV